MAFLTGPMRKHLNGQKELTSNKQLLEIATDANVYIPLANMAATTVELLVKEGDHVKVGTHVATVTGNFPVPLFSSVSGVVKNVEKMMHSSLRMIDHLVIENDGKYEQEAPFKPVDFEKASIDELVELMQKAGIVGCGGASFPTYVKYRGVKNVETLIINAVECEPFINSDYFMMHDYKELMVTGVRALLKMSQAKVAKVCIKVTKKAFIEEVKSLFKDYSNIEVVAVPDVYPMGWERTLVYEVLKKRYERLPIEVNAIVNNMTTAIAFANVLVNGMPIVEKYITVSGDGVKNPSVVKTRVGQKVNTIIEKCGGYTSEDILLIAGGPMMGKTVTNDSFVIDRSSNALTVLVNRNVDALACLRCGKCSDHCPSGLQPVRINMAAKNNDIDALEKLCVMDCVECGLCSYICPSRIDVTEGIRRAKRYMALKKK